MAEKPYARILLDSLSPAGKRITTFETLMPMHAWVHLLTHRMLSRNLQSSRAIPTSKLMGRANFVPEYWGKNVKGMQPDGQLLGLRKLTARLVWNAAQTHAKLAARILGYLGLHKETTNRVLTPYILVKGIVTATELDNFFKLRLDPHAQYDIRMIATQMQLAMNDSTPVERYIHAPFLDRFITTTDQFVQYIGKHFVDTADMAPELMHYMKISAARCARISYLAHDSEKIHNSADIELATRLASNGHLSPFEHVAICTKYTDQHLGNFFGWMQFRRLIENKTIR